MKKILIIIFLFVSITGMTQVKQGIEYKFYDTDITITTDEDTTTFNVKYYCTREAVNLISDKMIFWYQGTI